MDVGLNAHFLHPLHVARPRPEAQPVENMGSFLSRGQGIGGRRIGHDGPRRLAEDRRRQKPVKTGKSRSRHDLSPSLDGWAGRLIAFRRKYWKPGIAEL